MRDRDTQSLVETVQGLPEGQVIRWHDPGTADGMYLGAFLDVFADPVCHILEWGWAWVVRDPLIQWDDPPDSMDIMLPRDATYTDPEDGREVAAWHPETISRALELWVAEQAGRSDIRFEHDFDLYTPMQAWVDDIKAKEEAGLLEYVPAEAVWPELGNDADSGEGDDSETKQEIWIERWLAESLAGPPDPILEEDLGWGDEEDGS